MSSIVCDIHNTLIDDDGIANYYALGLIKALKERYAIILWTARYYEGIQDFRADNQLLISEFPDPSMIYFNTDPFITDPVQAKINMLQTMGYYQAGDIEFFIDNNKHVLKALTSFDGEYIGRTLRLK